jgi:predicted transposase YbfD/YdcC
MEHDVKKFCESIPDRRIDRKKLHPMPEIIFLFLCGCLANRTGWLEIFIWADNEEILRWLRKFYPYANGVPSVSTIARVISSIEPNNLQIGFSMLITDIIQRSWSKFHEIAELGNHCAIDGKTLRGAIINAKPSAIHIVNAFMNNMVIAQQTVAEKSNEITAIPILINVLNGLGLMSGTTISIDAMGCQKNIASQIIGLGGNYILGLKGNQTGFHTQVSQLFDEWIAQRPEEFMTATFTASPEKAHGRITTRSITQILVNDEWLTKASDWSGIKSVIMVRTITESGPRFEKRSEEIRYYISSLELSPQKALALVRNHWAVEILHFNLDRTFREDECRIRRGHGAENFSAFRKIAHNLLKLIQQPRESLKALMDDFLARPWKLAKRLGLGMNDAVESSPLQIAA